MGMVRPDRSACGVGRRSGPLVQGNPGAQPDGDRNRQARLQRRFPTSIRGISALGMQAVKLFYHSPESKGTSPPSARNGTPRSAEAHDDPLIGQRPLHPA